MTGVWAKINDEAIGLLVEAKGPPFEIILPKPPGGFGKTLGVLVTF
jgi:hypothetical protein